MSIGSVLTSAHDMGKEGHASYRRSLADGGAALKDQLLQNLGDAQAGGTGTLRLTCDAIHVLKMSRGSWPLRVSGQAR